MLARVLETLPPEGQLSYEPKWDGFRALVFRHAGDVYLQSRDLKPLARYFPELAQALIHALPDGMVLDGEIVIATPKGLDFDRLQLRLHPAASRVAKLAAEMPSSFVAFDVLALDGEDLRARPHASGARCSSRCWPTPSRPSTSRPPRARARRRPSGWSASKARASTA